MTEWWTYSLRDLLLFSPRTYYRLFELYNVALWPLQIITIALGVVILLLWQRGGKSATRVAFAILAIIWLWVAWAYHWQRYSSINWAANYYALAFIFEALLLLYIVVRPDYFTQSSVKSVNDRAGLAPFLISLLLFPLLGSLLGRPWAQAEVFGLAPDPTALLTLSMLLLYKLRSAWWLLPIPVAWCVISGATMWAMNAPEFVVVPLFALIVVSVIGFTNSTNRN